MLFKVVHGLVAVPLEGHVEKSVSRTRAKKSERLKVYAPATDILKNSFIPKTIKDWNNLPDSAVQSATVDIFKNEVKIALTKHFPPRKECDTSKGYYSSHLQIQIQIHSHFLKVMFGYL